MSKFDYALFYGDETIFAVSKEKYSKEQAIELLNQEWGTVDENNCIHFREMWVRHRAGIDENGDKQVCWWAEYDECKRSCPVYAFKVELKDKPCYDDFEVMKISEQKVVV